MSLLRAQGVEASLEHASSVWAYCVSSFCKTPDNVCWNHVFDKLVPLNATFETCQGQQPHLHRRCAGGVSGRAATHCNILHFFNMLFCWCFGAVWNPMLAGIAIIRTQSHENGLSQLVSLLTRVVLVLLAGLVRLGELATALQLYLLLCLM